MYEENAGLSRERAELEVRLETAEKELAASAERAEAARRERAEMQGVMDGMHMELGEDYDTELGSVLDHAERLFLFLSGK